MGTIVSTDSFEGFRLKKDLTQGAFENIKAMPKENILQLKDISALMNLLKFLLMCHITQKFPPFVPKVVRNMYNMH